MYCEKCGVKNDDGTKFCTSCGAAFEGENSADIVSDNGAQSSKPKKSILKMLLIPIAVVLLLGVVWVSAKDMILSTVAPELYVANLLNKTVDQVSKEVEESQKKMFGFSPKDSNELSVSTKVVLDSVMGQNLNGIGAEVSANILKKDKQVDSTYKFLYDDKTLLTGSFYLNDEEIGVNVAELFEEYWTVPSKNFGEAWNDSELRELSYANEIGDEIDLSYSNLFENKGLSEETIKKLNENAKALFKDLKVENKSNATLKIDDKDVKAKIYDIEIPGESCEEYVTATLQTLVDDENISAMLESSDAKSEIENSIEMLEENMELEDSLAIKLYEYKGKVVRMDAEMEIEEATVSFDVEFKNSKALINDVTAVIAVEVEGEKVEVIFNTEGNHMCDNNVYSDESSIVVKAPYGGDVFELTSVATLDFKQNKLDGEVNVMVDGDEVAIEYSGACANKDKFSVELDNIVLKEKRYNEKMEIDGTFAYTLDNKAAKIDSAKAEKKNIFEMDEDDLIDYFEDIEYNAMDLQDDFEDLVYDLYYMGF